MPNKSVVFSIEDEMKSIDHMFHSIDYKSNQIKSEKENSFKMLIVSATEFAFELNFIEDNLNQTRQEAIDTLKEIHDKSILEINQLYKSFKQFNDQQCAESMKEQMAKSTIKNAEKILESQATTPNFSYSPKLSHFYHLKYSNEFKGINLIKYLELMPNLLSQMRDYYNEEKKLILPITKSNKFILASYSGFEMHDKYIGLISTKSLKNERSPPQFLYDDDETISIVNNGTISIVNNHILIVRYLQESECSDDKQSNDYQLIKETDEGVNFKFALFIEVYDMNLKKIRGAIVKVFDSTKVFIHTCGNGILIQTIRQDSRMYTFALYSLNMNLKRNRINVEFKDLIEVPEQFVPIKFDNNECFIYKYDSKKYRNSILIYSFIDSTLLQVFICFQTKFILIQ